MSKILFLYFLSKQDLHIQSFSSNCSFVNFSTELHQQLVDSSHSKMVLHSLHSFFNLKYLFAKTDILF